MTRRELLALTAAPALIAADRPKVVSGVQAGDVMAGSAIIWAQADRPSTMSVTWSTSERSGERHRVTGPAATEATGFTARVNLTRLPAGQTIVYDVRFDDGEPVRGMFRTPGDGDVSMVWSADLAGQGYGINREWGGYRIFEAMRRRQPSFYLSSGDNIYADNPIPAELKLADGSVWRNIVTQAKSKVAETLAEFRGNYQYNLLDENLRRFNSEVSQIWQWDDHEVMNNWYFEKDLSADDRYREKDIRKIAARAAQAFHEFAPIRPNRAERQRVYRSVSWGPLMEVFVVDQRSYRGPNTYNRQATRSRATAYFGAAQLRWLGDALKRSKATWKIIASDMPIGLLVADGRDGEGRPRFEASANGDGPALGRELEIAALLRELKKAKVRNTVWLTADVHYTAAHQYRPDHAQFTDFDPFWEFVSGPLNAGTFGPGVLDNTFGPEVVFSRHPPQGKSNLPPSAGLQFFGELQASAKTLRVTLRDLSGAALFERQLSAS